MIELGGRVAVARLFSLFHPVSGALRCIHVPSRVVGGVPGFFIFYFYLFLFIFYFLLLFGGGSPVCCVCAGCRCQGGSAGLSPPLPFFCCGTQLSVTFRGLRILRIYGRRRLSPRAL